MKKKSYYHNTISTTYTVNKSAVGGGGEADVNNRSGAGDKLFQNSYQKNNLLCRVCLKGHVPSLHFISSPWKGNTYLP